MDRPGWLREKRRLAEERMDTLFAPGYDERWGRVNTTHHDFLQRFLALCSPQCTVLDAACGTGKYWSFLLAAGRMVVGVDQSARMLARARTKFPEVEVHKIGLQELAYAEAFDGALCVDALENLPPEDWPVALANLQRALKPGGPCYFTVELIDSAALRESLAASRRLGLPVVEGEWAHDGSYHYYPPLPRVRDWVRGVGFAILEEGEGDGYRHFLARRDERNARRLGDTTDGYGS